MTGGSYDVNPQWFTLPQLQCSAPNTFTELNVPLPVQRFNTKSGKSLVLEVLKVQFFLPESDTNPSAGGVTQFAQVQLGTIAQLAVSPLNPQNIAVVGRNWRGAFTAGLAYETQTDNPLVIDCTDAAGHGVLVATDSIFIDVNTSGFTGAAIFNQRILYRWKEITLQEYIGIVQSQQ